MATRKMRTADAADDKLIDLFDSEVEAEELEDLALTKAGIEAGLSRRAKMRGLTAKIRANALKSWGITADEAKKIADEDFAAARKSAADRRKKAAALLAKRLPARKQEVANMLARVRKVK